jgi:hypothetical protein
MLYKELSFIINTTINEIITIISNSIIKSLYQRNL